MKNILFFTIWGFVLLPQLSLAQTGLSISTNSPRHADILCKVEIPYIDAGERGEGVVWQFGDIANDSRDHLQLINSNYDTIAIYEKGRILHYLAKGDTLYYKGEQSRRAFDIYSQERPYIHFPFQFGDSIAGNYLGNSRLKENVCTATYSGSGAGELLSTGYCLSEGLALDSASVEAVNYYDNYRFLFKFEGHLGIPIEEVTADAVNHRGLLTGTLLKDTGGTASGTLAQNSRLVINCYDKKSRLSTSYTLAFGRHATRLHNEYSYCGDLASSTRGYYRYGTNGLELTGTVIAENTYYSGTQMLKRTETSYVGPGQNTVLENVAYSYDELGHVIKRDRVGTGSDMDYTYNLLNGTVNCIKVEGDSGFIQNIYRETGTAAPRYNGSISAMTWKIPGENVLRKYDYTYDEFNRLTKATYSEWLAAVPNLQSSSSSTPDLVPVNVAGTRSDLSGGGMTQFVTDLYGEEVAYDKNSNITSLRRMGATDTRLYGLIDDLSIIYQGNRRVAVQDAAGSLSYSGASDFVDGVNTHVEYTYNDNGALTKDLNRGITNIEYDNLGNPKKITFTDSRSIEYSYSSDGTKLRTVHKKPRVKNRLGGGIINWSRDTTEYIGNLILKNHRPVMLQFDGGFASFSHDTIDGLHYYIQDYMGNNRMVLNIDGTIEQVTHYYPYGGVIGDISTNENVQKYKFEGKELDRTFGLDNYDIHARQYFAMAPMWDRIDKRSEDYYHLSPYAYCGGDPVNLGDYDGKAYYEINREKGYLVKKHNYPESFHLVHGTDQSGQSQYRMFNDKKMVERFAAHDDATRKEYGIYKKDISNIIGRDKPFTYESNNGKEAKSFFEIMAKCTNKEWAIAFSSKSAEGKIGNIFVIGSQLNVGSTDYGLGSNYSPSDIVWDMHSHQGLSRANQDVSRGPSSTDCQVFYNNWGNTSSQHKSFVYNTFYNEIYQYTSQYNPNIAPIAIEAFSIPWAELGL